MTTEPSDSNEDASKLFERWSGGEADVADLFTETLYAELRILAHSYLKGERAGHTLQPTALVHEAFARLVGSNARAKDRRHFIGLAARTMRQVLVDHARRKQADKRIAPQDLVPLDTSLVQVEGPTVDILDLDRALNQLAALSSRGAKLVEVRFFGGLTNKEAADVLGLSVTSVEREWRAARAWLRGALA